MRVELKDIHKTFGAVHANAGINMTIPAGTIFGILGENGAGKSTLMKVLSGFIQADQGEILLDDRLAKIKSPADAIQHGIGMLHQDPLDFPPMTVVDNFLIGSNGGIIPNRTRAIADLLELEKQFGFSIPPEAYVDSMTVGERQQLEILRLLWLGVSVLILDEPTTGISALQKEKLFTTLRRLAGQGKAIIFVSHKLDEVGQLCHRVAVLRQGRLVGEMAPPYDQEKLVEMMFSKAISLGEKRFPPTGDTTLSIQDLSVEDHRLRLDHISLEVMAGEVIGLAGMEGSGQELFLRACAGLVRPTRGKTIVRGQDLTGKPYRAFLNHGVAYLPAARLEDGLIPGLTLADHFTLCAPPKGAFIQREYSRKLAKDRIAEFNIRGTPSSAIESLSGGNQQRALLSLMRDPLALVLLEHPTRGLDIESTIYIWSKLKERCFQRASILFISSDLEEILRYSDRVFVFFSGRVSPSMEAESTTVDQLGQLIGGKGLMEQI